MGRTHFCSRAPIPQRAAVELVARMPAAAQNDLLEWNPTTDTTAYLHQLLSHEMAIENDLHPNLKLRISYDRPHNEYFLLRRWKWISP